jgi:hypothetical protein
MQRVIKGMNEWTYLRSRRILQKPSDAVDADEENLKHKNAHKQKKKHTWNSS